MAKFTAIICSSVQKMMLYGLLVAILPLKLKAQAFRTDSIYQGLKGYTEYLPGNFPLIFAASHGGDLSPGDIPVRVCAGCVTATDLNTQELARMVREAIFKRTGCLPHVIINRLRRNRMDANREIGEAALGNPDAEQAWRDYHGFIDSAKQITTRNFRRGLFIDLHGHGHSIQRLELGYLLSATTLRLSDASLNAADVRNNSSIRKLTTDNRQQLSHSELLRGTSSLGALMEKSGYPSVPSNADPAPKSGQDYFSGGYSTARHGSVESGNIDAIQIECNYQGVRDSEPGLLFFADALAVSLLEYLGSHYFTEQPACQTVTSSAIQPSDLMPQVFPNPGCGTFNIENSEGEQCLEMMVRDISGKPLFRLNHLPPIVELPAGRYPNGLYWLVMKFDGGRIISRPLLQQCPE